LDRLKPHRSAETSPCGDAVLQGVCPIRRSMHASWVTSCSLRSHANRASLEQDQIGSRRTGAAHSRGLRGATLDVHYPAPIGSDTFFREIVDPPVGETDASERLRAVAELTLDFSVHRGSAFAHPQPFSMLSHAVWSKGSSTPFLREEDRDLRNPRCLPSVRNISDEAVGLAWRTR